MKTRLLVVAAVAATLSLAACGADDPQPASSPSDQQAKMKQSMLDFARCMRENGIDMPDPKFEGNRVTMRAGGPGKGDDPAKMKAAEKACAKYRDAVKPPELSPEKSAEFKKGALANAKCMREHGIAMPDPTFDENGGAQMKLDGDVNPESAKFQKAQQACRDVGGIGAGPSSNDVEEGGEK
jgi:predicted small lipoprotein YifL